MEPKKAKFKKYLGYRHVAALIVVVGIALVGIHLIVSSHAEGIAGKIPLGVYVGAANPSGVKDFASTTGTDITYASDYLPTSISTSWASAWTAGSLSWDLPYWNNSGYTLVLGVPIIPENDTTYAPLGTLADGAAGDYNSYYTTLAQTLVSDGESNAILRLGWEFNGTWYPWEVQSNTDATNFATYWRNIVNTMRAVSGANFKFDWNASSNTYVGWTLTDAWPGSSYVNYIGADAYDQSWDSNCGLPFNNTATATQSNCIFNGDILGGNGSGGEGLSYYASLSSQYGVPLTLPEWGLMQRGDGHGLGDDPTYIDNMASWMVDNNVAWASYFEYDPSGALSDLTDGNFPNSLAAYERDFAPNPGTTVTPPSVPTNLSAKVNSSTSVSLSWTGSTDSGGPGLGGYYVFRNGSKIGTVSSSTTSYTDSSASANTTYSYTVEAYDTASPPNVSGNSTTASATTPPVATVTPSTPTNVKATATGPTSVSVTWTASTDSGGPGIGGYYVLRNGSKVATVTSGTSYTDTSVVASTSYSYTVEAFDSSGSAITSSASSAASVTTLGAVTTSVTVPFYMEAGGAGFKDANGITWLADQDFTTQNNYGVTGSLPGGDGSSCTSAGADENCTTHAISGTSDQAIYQNERWGAFTYDIPVANGTYAVVLKFAEINPSSTARIFDVDINGNAVLTNLNIASEAGNYAADDHTFSATVTNNDLNISFTPSSNAAKLSALEILPQSALSVVPTTPTNVKATSSSETSASLSWSASTDSGGPGLKGYYIIRGGATVANVSATTTSYTDSSLSSGTSYSYVVEAYDSAGKVSAASSAANVTTTAPAGNAAPTVPAGLTASVASSSQINLSWSASTDPGGPGVAGYDIFRSGQLLNSSPVTSTSYGDTGLQPASPYSYYVTAVNTNGVQSSVSSTVTATTSKAVSDPTSVTGPFVNGVDNKCLDNYANVPANYNKIDIWACDGTGSQSWTYNPTTGTIVNTNGFCLDVHWDNTAPQTIVDLFQCNGTPAQIWSYNKTTDTISSPQSGLCLDDKYSGRHNGNQIWMYGCNNTQAQKWTLE